MSRSLIRKNQLHPDISDLVGQYGSGYFISSNQSINLSGVVYTTGNQRISGLKTFQFPPVINNNGVLSSFPRETGNIKFPRMPFGIAGTTAAATTSLTTGRASIVPFYIGQTITGFEAVSNKIGNTSNGPWDILVGLYNINSGIYSASLIDTASVKVYNTSMYTRQTKATFTGSGQNLSPGWYVLLSWFVSGNGAINNNSNFAWPNYGVFGYLFDTGTTNELPGSFFPGYYIMTGLTTEAPSNLNNWITNSTATSCPWYVPYY